MSGPVIIGSERSEVGLPAGDGDPARRVARPSTRSRSRCGTARTTSPTTTSAPAGCPTRGAWSSSTPRSWSARRAPSARSGRCRATRNPISVARAVLEQLPQHALLVGEGAALFARGMRVRDRRAAHRRGARLWREALLASARTRSRARTPRPAPATRPTGSPRWSWSRRLAPHDGPWGTINVLALDAHRRARRRRVHQWLPVQVPRPGRRFRDPRRGQLCDLRYGGAACTGRGELSMRATGARAVVERWPTGVDAEKACRGDARRRGGAAGPVPGRAAHAGADPRRPARRRRRAAGLGRTPS